MRPTHAQTSTIHLPISTAGCSVMTTIETKKSNQETEWKAQREQKERTTTRGEEKQMAGKNHS
jgi:hypothetical protein